MSMLLKKLADAEAVAPKTRQEYLALLPEKDYSDGKTVQSFKDETDINKLLARAQRAGTLSHLEEFEGVYGDFSDFDFFTAQTTIARGYEIFDKLPSEVRKEFHNSPQAFYEYVNDPANQADLAKKLPSLAAPGRQNIDVSGKTPPVAASAAPSEPSASVPTPPEGQAAAPSSDAPPASNEA